MHAIPAAQAHRPANDAAGDDTGWTVVQACSCGESFLGFGEDRLQTAQRSFELHRARYVVPRDAPAPKRERRVRLLSEIVGGPGAWIINPDSFEWTDPSRAGGGKPGRPPKIPDDEILRRLRAGESTSAIVAAGAKAQRVARIREEAGIAKQAAGPVYATEAQIIEALEAGNPVKRIAHDLRTSAERVRRIRDERGIAVVRRTRSTATDDDIREALAAGEPVLRIAARLSVGQLRVRRVRDRMDGEAA